MYKGHKIKAISYGDENYSMSLKVNLISAKLFGQVDEIEAFSPNDLSEEFISENKEILGLKRGAGYWIWKPYIMLKALESIKENDYLIYTDAGMIYVSSVFKLINQIEKDGQDIFLTSGFVPNKEWCKRDTFVLMECDTEEAKNKVQISGGYILIKKNKKNIDFLNEWLKYNCVKEIITDMPNTCGLPNDGNFHEHRHDQAVLTNLAYKWNIYAYKGVTHVDEPRAHIRALHGKTEGYGYSFEERIKRIKVKHKEIGYQNAEYGRMFINTRIKNCFIIMFILRFIRAVLFAMYTDVWGSLFDKKYLEDIDEYSGRN